MGQSSQVIQLWLIAAIAHRLGVDPQTIDVRDSFSALGLDSRQAIGLAGELEQYLGRNIPPTIAYDYPTIQELCRYLSSDMGTALHSDRQAYVEPVAIIGLGCRFPGAANPLAFWHLLSQGVDAVGTVPEDRWRADLWYDADSATPGKMCSRWGGFLDRVDLFDAGFFGIAPREAARMDPQQRLLLEVVWEALEDAGQPMERLAGSRTGVFIGISSNDYAALQFSDPRLIDGYACTGNALSIAANRLSYFFDFRGPSMALDTACSSSLVAVHMACGSLWQGDAELAVAGGVNLVLSPFYAINFTKAGVLSPDGRCKAFDARANGYVRGEGVGIVILKRLSKALAEGDAIYAIIRSSAVNQDGRTNGLMAPNQGSQEALLQDAYARAGVDPAQVDFVEAHGTGTILGDPIEAKALGNVLSQGRDPHTPLLIGSVKSNIGHLEAAAGVAGLIKVVLALQHCTIPPSIHYHQPNPYIPFDELRLQVAQRAELWPDRGRKRLAGVSSFGFGGTNSHVVLEEAPGGVLEPVPSVGLPPLLLSLSARSEEALAALAGEYQRLLIGLDTSGGSLLDVCYSAGVRRSHHDYRLAITGLTAAEMAEKLAMSLQGKEQPGMARSRYNPADVPKLVFVFPGQGWQWIGMGQELLSSTPVFRQALEEIDLYLREHVRWSLVEELMAPQEAEQWDSLTLLQPVLFALQVALVRLWRSWGVMADAVLGHSMGEIAAAHCAGVLSLEEAVRLVCIRSALLAQKSGQGTMAVVDLPSAGELQNILHRYTNRVSIAAYNSPRSTMLAGAPEAIEELVTRFQAEGIFARRVKANVASHCYQMDTLLDPLVTSLQHLKSMPAAIPMYSTVTGDVCEDTALDASYWARNLRQPVLFAPCVERLADAGHALFLEVSCQPVLAGAISQVLRLAGRQGVVLPSGLPQRADREVLLETLTSLYVMGRPIVWQRVLPAGGKFVRLPSNPWQRQRYWLDVPGQAEHRAWEAASAAGATLHREPPADTQDWLYRVEWRRAGRHGGTHCPENHGSVSDPRG